MDARPDARLVIHSSWRGLLGALISVVILIALTAAAWRGGATIVSIGLTIITMVVVAVAVADYPIAADFRRDGVVRRCLLRHQRLAWERIDAVSRTADTMTLGSEQSPGAAPDGPSRAGRGRGRGVRGRPAGLVAVVGRRRYLLVNQCESQDECERLRDLLVSWQVPTRWRAGLPDPAQPPTWLYRRRRWRP